MNRQTKTTLALILTPALLALGYSIYLLLWRR